MFDAVRRQVRKIPKGQVATYGEIARAAGFPGASRQVAWALRGADMRGIPWHRVVGAGGRILLPGESGMEQRLRLQNEGVVFENARVPMERYEFQFRPARKTR